jgi:hypothetical protein
MAGRRRPNARGYAGSLGFERAICHYLDSAGVKCCRLHGAATAFTVAEVNRDRRSFGARQPSLFGL